MAEVEFIYNGVPTIIQCKRKDKMKDICQKFKGIVNINNNIYIYILFI